MKAAGVLAAVLLLGCDDAFLPAEEPYVSSSSTPVETSAEDDDVEPPPPSAWPADVDDLAASLEQWQGVEACVAALRERTPTELAEGLTDLGYDGFTHDVCRGLAAVHDRSVEGCDALTVSSLRRGCRARLAVLAADPTLCPEDTTHSGRDPTCVAWAARDPGLCRAAPPLDRPRCEAVLDADASRCDALTAGDRERCHASRARYGAALGSERHTSPGTREDPVFHLDVVRLLPRSAGTPPTEGEPLALELTELSRGVMLRPDGCRYRAILARATGDTAIAELHRGAARIEVVVPEVIPGDVRIGPTTATVSVVVPDLGRATGGEGEVHLDRLEAVRGGAVAGTLRATLPLAPGSIRVEGRFSTFVRDLEPLPELCSRR